MTIEDIYRATISPFVQNNCTMLYRKEFLAIDHDEKVRKPSLELFHHSSIKKKQALYGKNLLIL
jgi:hypothetical protein